MNFSCLFLYSQQLQNSDLATQLLEILITTTFVSRIAIYTSAMPLNCRVLARISKMPVQNSNFKVSAHPDLTTDLLQILIPPAISNSKWVKKGNLHFSYVLEDGLLGKYLVITTQKSKLKNLHRIFCLSKQEVFRKLPVQKTGRTCPG